VKVKVNDLTPNRFLMASAFNGPVSKLFDALNFLQKSLLNSCRAALAAGNSADKGTINSKVLCHACVDTAIEGKSIQLGKSDMLVIIGDHMGPISLAHQNLGSSKNITYPLGCQGLTLNEHEAGTSGMGPGN